MLKRVMTAAALVILAAPAVAQAQEATWLHVRVDEADGAKVRVNLPTSMVDVALEIAEKQGLQEEHIEWDDHEVSLQDIRRLWREMRDAGDAEFVDVRDGDEHVRVFREGDRVHVRVDEDGAEKVRVEMPAEVADALLSGEGESLNLRAAMEKLAATGARELVRVQDRDASVRVWVDNRSGQEGEEGRR